ncbi:MAG: hypothetical protein LBT43_07475 [Prevotella sp.]|jgi:dsDNA-specific endonuclease/ATPase MutS2|nr:hypothetical protein [Prevotella sp.]
MDKIEHARHIIKRRLFATKTDYNNLIEGIEELEQVARENREKLSFEKRLSEIEKRKKKIEKLNHKSYVRTNQGLKKVRSAALNKYMDNIAHSIDDIKEEIKQLKSSFDVSEFRTAEIENGYQAMDAKLNPANNIDYTELFTHGIFVWKTNRGYLTLKFDYKTVASSTVIDDKDRQSCSYTYEITANNLVRNLMYTLHLYLDTYP